MKRTGFSSRGADLSRSSTLKAKPVAERKPPKEAKRRKRKCAVKTCRAEFEPRSMTHKVCGPACAKSHMEAEKARKEKRERQEGLRKLKRRADYIAETQRDFNAYIRERDRLAGHACISSGKPLDWSGNNVDAGHYRSRGSAPHLRFDERNCHAQSKQENRYASGNATDYRLGLIARYGLAYVEELEADNTERKFSIADLVAIRATYKAKLKELRSQG